jgi:hypothetical protein
MPNDEVDQTLSEGAEEIAPAESAAEPTPEEQAAPSDAGKSSVAADAPLGEGLEIESEVDDLEGQRVPYERFREVNERAKTYKELYEEAIAKGQQAQIAPLQQQQTAPGTLPNGEPDMPDLTVEQREVMLETDVVVYETLQSERRQRAQEWVQTYNATRQQALTEYNSAISSIETADKIKLTDAEKSELAQTTIALSQSFAVQQANKTVAEIATLAYRAVVRPKVAQRVKGQRAQLTNQRISAADAAKAQLAAGQLGALGGEATETIPADMPQEQAMELLYNKAYGP